MPPHGPGPQPPSDGRPFFLILNIAVKDSACTDELEGILQSQKAWSLAQGAKSFSIGRNVSGNSISVVEVNIASSRSWNCLCRRTNCCIIERYEDVDGFRAVHSPPEKTPEYVATRAKIMELEVGPLLGFEF